MAIGNEEKDVRKWHSRIDISRRHKDQVGRHWHWHHNVSKYEGAFHELQHTTDIAIPPIQLVFAYIKTELPRLYLRDPHIKINAKKKSTIQAAKILELAVNYIWRTKRVKRQIKRNIIDGKLVGHSWFKSGYTGKFGAIEDHEGNIQEFVESEDFFGYRVPWQQIYFDLDSMDPPHDTSWIAHEFFVPLEDLKKDSNFINVDTIQAAGPKPLHNRHTGGQSRISSIKGSSAAQSSGNALESDVPMVQLFEIWDKKEQKVFTIAEGSTRYIKKPTKWPYDMKGFPFSYLRFHETIDGAYGIPDVTMLMPQFLEKIKIRASQLDHIKRFNRQYITKPNNIDDENKTALEEARSGAVIEALEGVGSVAAIPYPPLPQDAYAVEDRVDRDAIIVGGQSPLELGAPAKTQTRTIKEAVEQRQGSENRRSEQIDIVEDFVEDISQNLIGLLQQFADEPFYVSVTGEDPRTIINMLEGRPSAVEDPNEAITGRDGFTFTKKDIQGEFDVDVVSGSSTPLNKAAVLEILTQIAPLAQQLGAMPGGPVAGAIAGIFGELLDIPELKVALEQEFRLVQEQREAQSESVQQQRQLEAANDASQTQIQAERIQVQNQKNLLTAAVEAEKIRQKDRDSKRRAQ